MIFSVAEDRRMRLTGRALAMMRQFVQSAPDAPEAGGLLLGYLTERNHLLVINQVTVPAHGDVRERFGFERLDPAHNARVREAWGRTAGGVNCWGTWHTHAEPNPKPSPLDLESWREDMVGECAFHLIVGTEQIGVWYGEPGKLRALGSASTALLIRRAAAILVESSATNPSSERHDDGEKRQR